MEEQPFPGGLLAPLLAGPLPWLTHCPGIIALGADTVIRPVPASGRTAIAPLRR
jgi:hypothetical protein